jgi:hypothetical protein
MTKVKGVRRARWYASDVGMAGRYKGDERLRPKKDVVGPASI